MAKNVIINGNVYADVPYIDVPKSDNSGDAHFYDTSDATATAAQVLAGSTFYKDGGKENGGMTNNGATGGTISTKAGSVTIPAGYTTGGSVTISSTEQAKIVAGNIKSGVTILGQAGSSVVVDTTVAAGSAASASTIMSGYSAYVNGAKVDGSATVPTITQNSSTKVLRIA